MYGTSPNRTRVTDILFLFISIGGFIGHLWAFLSRGLDESFLSVDLGRTTGYVYNLIIFWPSAIMSFVGNLYSSAFFRKEGRRNLALMCAGFATLTIVITFWGFHVSKHIFTESYRAKVKTMDSVALVKVPIEKRILKSLAGQELISNRRNDMFSMLDRKELFTDSELFTIFYILAEKPDMKLLPYVVAVEKQYIDNRYLMWRYPLEVLEKYELALRAAAYEEIEKYAISVNASEEVLKGIRYFASGRKSRV